MWSDDVKHPNLLLKVRIFCIRDGDDVFRSFFMINQILY